MLIDAGGWVMDAGGRVMDAGGWVMDAGGWVMDAGRLVMDAGGWVMDAGTRPVSRVGRQEVRCGNTRCLLRQGKTSVVARNKGGGLRPPPQRGGAAFGRPPLCGFLCVGCEHWAYLSVEMQDMCLVESQDIRLAEMQDMCCA